MQINNHSKDPFYNRNGLINAELYHTIFDHKKALDMVSRIKNQDEKIKAIHREFRRNMSFAMKRLNENKAASAPEYIKRGNHYLSEMQSAIKHQRGMEKDLIDITKKTIYDLKQEKNTLDS